jgi:hypothetical protein
MLANARSSFYERGLAARTCVLSALSHCFEIPRRPAAARISFVSDTTLEFRLRVACVTSKLRVTLRTRHYKGQQQEKQLNKRTTVAVARAEVCQPRNRSHLRSQGTQPCLRERLSGWGRVSKDFVGTFRQRTGSLHFFRRRQSSIKRHASDKGDNGNNGPNFKGLNKVSCIAMRMSSLRVYQRRRIPPQGDSLPPWILRIERGRQTAIGPWTAPGTQAAPGHSQRQSA